MRRRAEEATMQRRLTPDQQLKEQSDSESFEPREKATFRAGWESGLSQAVHASSQAAVWRASRPRSTRGPVRPDKPPNTGTCVPARAGTQVPVFGGLSGRTGPRVDRGRDARQTAAWLLA